jgi:hypothetical protein
MIAIGPVWRALIDDGREPHLVENLRIGRSSPIILAGKPARRNSRTDGDDLFSDGPRRTIRPAPVGRFAGARCLTGTSVAQ